MLKVRGRNRKSFSAPNKAPEPVTHSHKSSPAQVPILQRNPICLCDGGCPSCSGVIQPKLEIAAPNDKYEQEADRVADQMMRMPETAMQRKAGCSSCGDLDEEEPIQTKSFSNKSPPLTTGLQNQIHLLKGSGQQLPKSTRNFFEPRFSADFSYVQVHTGAQESNIAKSINARAFTTGQDVVFGNGEYSPNSSKGKKLLAHELTHVIQQDNKKPNVSLLQRKVVVNPNITAAKDILSQFQFLCPHVNFSLKGQHIIGDSSSIASKGCECVSDAAGDPDRTYTIKVKKIVGNDREVKLYDGRLATIPFPNSYPRTRRGANPTIYMPDSKGSTIEFGAFATAGAPFWYRNWRILAHELCGHARLDQSYSGSTGNRPGHDVTIDTENEIAAEQGQIGRGHYSDTRQGESFFNQIGNSSKVAFILKDGWHYEAP
jgi:Domain of unknown function (DUF4157)